MIYVNEHWNGIQTAKLNGKQIGQRQGAKLKIKKKELIEIRALLNFNKTG